MRISSRSESRGQRQLCPVVWGLQGPGVLSLLPGVTPVYFIPKVKPKTSSENSRINWTMEFRDGRGPWGLLLRIFLKYPRSSEFESPRVPSMFREYWGQSWSPFPKFNPKAFTGYFYLFMAKPKDMKERRNICNCCNQQSFSLPSLLFTCLV